MTGDTGRIAIVGAGIAGLTLATLLRRAGIECDLYEQTSRLSAVGAGIQLPPNGVRLLGMLGARDALARHGVVAEHIASRRWSDGRLLAQVPHGDLCTQMYAAPYVLMHRADLQAALLDLLPGDAGLGRRVAAVTEYPGHVELRLAGGRTTRAALVIGADGVHSVVRPAVVRDEPRHSGYSVYRGLVPADQLRAVAADAGVTFWFGPGRHVTYYPVAGRRTVHFSAVAATPAAPGDPAAELRALFAGWHPAVRRVVTAAETVTRWTLSDRDLARRYTTQRIALVGDAAHPTLPYLSQGAGQALEDAVTLARLLTAGLPPAVALRRYERLRRSRTAEIHRQARAKAVTYHLPDGPAQRRRDAYLHRHQTLEHLRWIYAGGPSHAGAVPVVA
ncbi:FAD-dependent monooxygenase [Dactylosporangium sp. NPDC051484]|uniref:FAD-dependent monooxygenase n=1 Tax=Dactylosporangium sp. NPDC051484 TaxID=3154942 RepID=UPI00344FCA46